MTRLQIERRVFWTVTIFALLVFWAWFFPELVHFVVWLLLLLYRVA